MIDFMEERVEDAIEELKRADHLIYVSLKYTRTCDTIRNIIKRLISTYDLAIKDLLEFDKKKKIIKETPVSSEAKIKITKKILGKMSNKYLHLYEILRLIDKSEYERHEEFRKGITLITKTKKPIKVKTDTLHEYFETTTEFVQFVLDFMKKIKDKKIKIKKIK